jgi:tetratricopeptide (TPR) repeat protein
MRRTALPFLLLAACSTLSSEDREQLSTHQQNAKLYLEGGDLQQAYNQIARGLELEPDDYLLRTLRGVLLLRTSASALGSDHKRLDEATEALADVFAERAANRHEPYLLLNYALALQKQGRRRAIEALRLREQAGRSAAAEAEVATASAATAEALADEHLTHARDLLLVLVDRGEVLRHAHRHLLVIAQDRRDTAAFAEHGKAYVAQAAAEEKALRKEIERTLTPGYEAEQTKALRELLDEEIDVRELLAEHCYQQRDWKGCVEHLDRSLLLDPKRSVDYYNRGRARLELGQREAAKEDFRKFLATTSLPATSDKKTFALSALGQ